MSPLNNVKIIGIRLEYLVLLWYAINIVKSICKKINSA